MISYGDKRHRSQTHTQRLTEPEQKTSAARRRHAAILDGDNLAIIVTNLRLQAGIPVDRISR